MLIELIVLRSVRLLCANESVWRLKPKVMSTHMIQRLVPAETGGAYRIL